MKKVTLEKLNKMKEANEPIAALTAYDALFAKLISDNGIELILVGDSLGPLVLGHETTIPVTINDMAHHTRACTSKKPSAFVMTDMPFETYATKEDALENAAHLMQAGAEMVKLEGGSYLTDTVAFLSERGIPICGHLGLMPQYVQTQGGYRFDRKKTIEIEETMIHDAKALQDAGAQLLILKCVRSAIAETITQLLSIPVIGIGAGPHVDGQIQILYDLLGFGKITSTLLSERYLVEDESSKQTSYIRDFLSGQSEGISGAIRRYIQAVKQKEFPTLSESFS